MKEKRISHVVGKGSLTHNNRCFFAKNVDISRTPQNVEIVRIPLAKAYDDLFSEAVERYNDKQTRKCRRIDTDYFFHLFNHKVCDYTLVANNKQKSFYEDLVQVGDMHDTGCGTPDAEIAKQCLIEYAEHYIKNNSNFYVFNAVIHMDEATPHLHINYIPVGHYSKGLDTRNAMAKALEEMGYTGVNAATNWREHERAVFTEICKSHGLEIAAPQKSRGYNFTVDEYKDIQEEKKRLTEELQPLREMELAADESKVIGKKQLLSHNITVTPEELQQLEKQKKAVAVQTLDNQNKLKGFADREKALDERETEIAVKEEESLLRQSERSRELDIRENDIIQSEKRVNENLSYAEKKISDAESKMKTAEQMYVKQSQLNQWYAESQREIRQIKKELDEKRYELINIRRAVDIPPYDKNSDPIEKINKLKDENYTMFRIIDDELQLPFSQMKKTPSEMLSMLIDKFRSRIVETEKEISESRSLIDRLTDQLAYIKQSFVKVVLAVNTLVYSKQHNKGLTGISKALATCISLFTDKVLKNLGEYDTINKCAIDDEIGEKMHLFTEKTTERNYYER